MLKRMNAPRRPVPVAVIPVKPSRCPPLPLEIWTQIMRTVVYNGDLPELWRGIRLLSHTLKAALETAFADEHLKHLRGRLYGPQQDRMRPQRMDPISLQFWRFSPDRRRVYFVPKDLLEISPSFAECGDNTVVAKWLVSAPRVPPPGASPTEGKFALAIGPAGQQTQWQHLDIGRDRRTVEERIVTFKDDGADDGTNERKACGIGTRAIGLEVDRTKCEVSLEWLRLVNCVFSKCGKTFGQASHGQRS
ncbi:hypothetical protein F5B19DRAFT_179220 [Rostrohypoxylon terebratum]|nr:hypothetical protein F5B19DRAFT_179220 [Rostrohypoxylon terebratum]